MQSINGLDSSSTLHPNYAHILAYRNLCQFLRRWSYSSMKFVLCFMWEFRWEIHHLLPWCKACVHVRMLLSPFKINLNGLVSLRQTSHKICIQYVPTLPNICQHIKKKKTKIYIGYLFQTAHLTDMNHTMPFHCFILCAKLLKADAAYKPHIVWLRDKNNRGGVGYDQRNPREFIDI